MLYNIYRGDWDDDILAYLKIPRALLPEVQPSSAVYGEIGQPCARRADPAGGHRGRSAGGDLRAGVFHARHGEKHLWHRELSADEHGRIRRAVRIAAC